METKIGTKYLLKTKKEKVEEIIKFLNEATQNDKFFIHISYIDESNKSKKKKMYRSHLWMEKIRVEEILEATFADIENMLNQKMVKSN